MIELICITGAFSSISVIHFLACLTGFSAVFTGARKSLLTSNGVRWLSCFEWCHILWCHGKIMNECCGQMTSLEHLWMICKKKKLSLFLFGNFLLSGDCYCINSPSQVCTSYWWKILTILYSNYCYKITLRFF